MRPWTCCPHVAPTIAAPNTVWYPLPSQTVTSAHKHLLHKLFLPQSLSLGPLAPRWFHGLRHYNHRSPGRHHARQRTKRTRGQPLIFNHALRRFWTGAGPVVVERGQNHDSDRRASGGQEWCATAARPWDHSSRVHFLVLFSRLGVRRTVISQQLTPTGPPKRQPFVPWRAILRLRDTRLFLAYSVLSFSRPFSDGLLGGGPCAETWIRFPDRLVNQALTHRAGRHLRTAHACIFCTVLLKIY